MNNMLEPFGSHGINSMFGEMNKMMKHFRQGFEDHFNSVNEHFHKISTGETPGYVESMCL